MNIISPDPEPSKLPRLFKAFIVFQIFTLLLGLAAIGGIIWVAWHFISKFW